MSSTNAHNRLEQALAIVCSPRSAAKRGSAPGALSALWTTHPSDARQLTRTMFVRGITGRRRSPFRRLADLFGNGLPERFSRAHQLIALDVLVECGDDTDATFLDSILASRTENQVYCHSDRYTGPSYFETPDEEWTETHVSYPAALGAGLDFTIDLRTNVSTRDAELHSRVVSTVERIRQRART